MAGTVSRKLKEKAKRPPSKASATKKAAIKAERPPEISLSYWTDDTTKKAIQSAFRNKNQWVVPSTQSLANWYSVIISNLACRYSVPEEASIDSVRTEIEKGFKKSAFDRLKVFIDTSADDLSRVIRVSSRTLARRSTFKPDETERLLRVAAAFQRSVEVMEDLDKARRWFSSPKRALGGKTPLEFCDTEPGADEVMNLLGRIEYGVFS